MFYRWIGLIKRRPRDLLMMIMLPISWGGIIEKLKWGERGKKKRRCTHVS